MPHTMKMTPNLPPHHFFKLCVCVRTCMHKRVEGKRRGMYVPWHPCGGQRTTLYDQFSPSTITGIPGLELRSLGL